MKRIICIDDEVELLNLYKNILESIFDGYEVTTYSDPLDFLAQRDRSFDLLVLDLSLNANITGADIAKQMRDEGDDSPIVVLSGFHPSSTKEYFKGIRINGFYQKGANIMECLKDFTKYIGDTNEN